MTERYVVKDDLGDVIAGPFDTCTEAHAAADEYEDRTGVRTTVEQVEE